ncbi:N-6 DNA methylase [Kutzneria kofuensis]|uniref:DNA methylase adenine-specific domain-containing protein n=1 Tax=Kutzneria kofuensis TaxID=103725 RepID=A0A7W9NF50_9PSEU|nr:N-6 DNA methylase [Kutzneria kofuensis]MBB5890330.1 hypothetical protein [Kutzneria kofuensis]
MNHDATVSAADIARLVDVGRAAVSNWRRRFDDFPRPVGGSAASPLFSLTEVEDWLRRNGKAFKVSTAERAWQALRSNVDDLRLGDEVARVGMFLAGSGGFDDSRLAQLLNRLAAEHGAAEAFELIVARYVDAHSRRLAVTPPAVAELMVRLACPDGGVVLDPACGVGTLPMASTAHEVLVQDVDRAAMVIASCRLTLRDTDVDMVTGDSLRRDGFAGRLVDAVLCDPPVNDRTWGHEELVGDPRWEYGVPPRGEPELAWVQHCLAHVEPGGMVAILMPPTTASRRPGRRIRAKLLRTGALRAVIALPDAGSDLWLLCRPTPELRPPSTVLITDRVDGVETAWLDPAAEDAVRIIDLLDDDVDISPARRRQLAQGPDIGREFADAVERFRGLDLTPPDLAVLAEHASAPTTTVGDLVRSGALGVRHAPVKVVPGDDVPVLTLDDLAEGRPASERAADTGDLLLVEPGDVVAAPTGMARVATEAAALGPYLTAYRVDDQQLDARFLAGALRASTARPVSGSSRLDVRRTQVPRLPLAEQRACGEAFERLLAFEDRLRQAAAIGGAVVRLGVDGLVEGSLRPGR